MNTRSLGGDIAARRPDGTEHALMVDILVEHRHQRAVRKLAADREIRHAGQADASLGEHDERLNRAARRGDRQDRLGSADRPGERPLLELSVVGYL